MRPVLQLEPCAFWIPHDLVMPWLVTSVSTLMHGELHQSSCLSLNYV